MDCLENPPGHQGQQPRKFAGKEMQPRLASSACRRVPAVPVIPHQCKKAASAARTLFQNCPIPHREDFERPGIAPLCRWAFSKIVLMGTDFSNKPNLTQFFEGFWKCRGRKLDHCTHPGSGLCGTVQWPQLHGKVGKDQTWGPNF